MTSSSLRAYAQGMNARALVSGLCLLVVLAGTARLEAGSGVDDLARFLAGLELPASSVLASRTRTDWYRRHARLITAAWAHYRQTTTQPLGEWARRQRLAGHKRVLYPFAGPDLVNALTIFPAAESILLFGLEPPGQLPDIATMGRASLEAGLDAVRGTLTTFLTANHFFTREMGRRMDATSLASVSGLFLFFLAASDCEVLRLSPIALGATGRIEPGRDSDSLIDPASSPRQRIPGIEILFRKNSGPARTIRYFMLDVSDAALGVHSPGFAGFLRSGGRYATILKAASYLLHRDSRRDDPPHFATLREILLGQSDIIIQDDSGIPLRFFRQADWRLAFFGKYTQPVPEFAHRMQQDLWDRMCYTSGGPLPFFFGYDRRPGAANVMIAERTR